MKKIFFISLMLSISIYSFASQTEVEQKRTRGNLYISFAGSYDTYQYAEPRNFYGDTFGGDVLFGYRVNPKSDISFLFETGIEYIPNVFMNNSKEYNNTIYVLPTSIGLDINLGNFCNIDIDIRTKIGFITSIAFSEPNDMGVNGIHNGGIFSYDFVFNNVLFNTINLMISYQFYYFENIFLRGAAINSFSIGAVINL